MNLLDSLIMNGAIIYVEWYTTQIGIVNDVILQRITDVHH